MTEHLWWRSWLGGGAIGRPQAESGGDGLGPMV